MEIEEHVEAEEQVEGHEQQVQGGIEHGTEDVVLEHLNLDNLIGQGQEVFSGEVSHQQETQHRVSSVEEITGQNFNQAYIYMQSRPEQNFNIQTSPQITSTNDVQMGNLNFNINEVNLANNSAQLRGQIVQTRINNGNYINQINIQKEQQQYLTQNPVYMGEVQSLISGQIIQNDPQYTKNIVKNAQYTQNIQSNDLSLQSRDPMMYSFGAKSSSIEGPNIAANDNKNNYNLNNNDFISSSITNHNNINLDDQHEKIVFETNTVKATMNAISSDQGNNLLYGQMQMVGNQIGVSSPEQIYSAKREPVDGDSKKKQAQEISNKEEVSDFPLEPRDSRRKN